MNSEKTARPRAKTDAERSPRIGVIGLGKMGAPMTSRLLSAFPGSVAVTARRPEQARPLVDEGAGWAGTPRELGEQCDVVLSVLPDLPQLEAALEGEDGILAGARGRDLLLVICSTSSPVGVGELAERLGESEEGRVRVVDAPVSGGVEGAEAGTLSIMVGGAEEDVERAEPVLRACGTPEHLGPLGSGQVAKACNQLVVGATAMALGEAAALASRSGLDVGRLFDLLSRGYADSRVLRTRGVAMAAQDYRPGGLAAYMVKDLRFGADVAGAADVNPALLPVLLESYEELVDRGLGNQDLSVTRRYVEER
jgi:2-hydroxy-3-oxopropionate reductase